MTEGEPDAAYLVIGGGSAGAVIAGRLAEAGQSTLLIEAGPVDRHPLIHVPAGVRYLLNDPRVAWQDRTQPDAATGSRAIGWQHGRVLGGSGSINGMIFVRGNRADFDRWAQSGAAGWDYDSVLPHFRALERYRGQGGPDRGRDGPLVVEDARFLLPVTRDFVAAAQAAGHRLLPDINAPEGEGVGYAQMNRRGRVRHSSARSHLKLGRRSGKLRIETGWQVERLLFDGRRCIGVAARRGEEVRRFLSGRETIVSAGAIGSPHLLMLSGVGAPEPLQALGIAPFHALPGVGENLMDHYGVRIAFRARGVRTVNELSRFPRLFPEVLRWALTGGGVLTTGVTAAMVFCRSDSALDYPDLQLLFSPTSFDRDRYGALEREPGVSVTVCLAQPHSRGRLTLASADPAERPLIHPGYLSAPRDLEVLLAGIAETRRIAAQAPLAQVLSAETLPGTGQSREALVEHVRGNGVSIFHPTGTCRMGLDPMAVVDPRLSVRGLSGLRVADASVMPVITSGNTNAPTMMIGEKAASMILEDAAAGQGGRRVPAV